jgi:hypothetical protein
LQQRNGGVDRAYRSNETSATFANLASSFPSY